MVGFPPNWEMMAGSSHSTYGVFGHRRVRRTLPLLIISLLVLALAVAPTRSVLAQTSTLTLSTSGAGAGTVTSIPPGISCPDDCTEDYTDGTTVTLTVSPAPGSLFAGWSGGGCSGTGACQFTISIDTLVTAAFNVAPPASISISPTQGSPGATTVLVSGSNFNADTYNITYDGTPVGTVITGAGSWSQSFNVPKSTTGSHTVAVGTASAPFIVEPRTSLSPNRGPVGTRVSMFGDGFASGQAVTVEFDGEEVVSATASTAGSFTDSFIIPPRSAGSHQVTVGGVFNQTFTVTSSLSIDPSSGPPGTTLSLNGTGFGANATISITLDGKTVRSISVDSQGSISTSFQVPVAPSGPRSVGVSDPSRGTTQSTFTVTPMLSLDRLNISPGSSVTATGAGFAANEFPITVTIDQTPVATGIAADANGSWTSSLIVPSLPSGSHTARASGALTSIGTAAAVTFTLGAGLSLERSSGSPGTAVEVRGSGFGPMESITVTVGDSLTEVGASANSQGVWTADVCYPSGSRRPLDHPGFWCHEPAPRNRFYYHTRCLPVPPNRLPGLFGYD